MPNKICFLDLDDVLADFEGGAAKAFGFTKKELTARRTPGVWDHTNALGVSNTQYWKRINSLGEDFWANLEPLPWFVPLLKFVNTNFKQWFILTSPGKHAACYSGKYKWAEKHMGKLAHDRLIIFPHKWIVSKKDSVLVDDRPQNLWNFEFTPKGEPRGGNGILFPTIGNPLHSLSENPIAYVEEQLSAFNSQKRKRRIPPVSDFVTGKR